MPGPSPRFWNKIRKALPPRTQATRIENRAGTGTPDVYLMMDGLSFWIELKAPSGRADDLRPSQQAWHARHIACGGRSYVFSTFPRSPYLRLKVPFSGPLSASGDMACGPTIYEGDDMGEALLALRADGLAHATAVADALRADALRADALRADALRADALRADALRADALRADALPCGEELRGGAPPP